MTKCVLSFFALIVPVFGSILTAQDTDLFNGNGIKGTWGDADSSSYGGKTDRSFFNFHRNQDGSESEAHSSAFQMPKFELPKFSAPKWKMPKLFQSHKYPKAVQMSDSEQRGVFSGVPGFDTFNRTSPGQPGFLQRMNQKTKDAAQKTRNGFSNLGERSRATWDSITRGVGNSDSSEPPLQPNLRSSQNRSDVIDKF